MDIRIKSSTVTHSQTGTYKMWKRQQDRHRDRENDREADKKSLQRSLQRQVVPFSSSASSPLDADVGLKIDELSPTPPFIFQRKNPVSVTISQMFSSFWKHPGKSLGIFLFSPRSVLRQCFLFRGHTVNGRSTRHPAVAVTPQERGGRLRA